MPTILTRPGLERTPGASRRPDRATIENNHFSSATGSEWNLRIASVRVDLLGDSGASGTQVAEVDLTQSGLVTLRRVFAKPPAADDLYRSMDVSKVRDIVLRFTDTCGNPPEFPGLRAGPNDVPTATQLATFTVCGRRRAREATPVAGWPWEWRPGGRRDERGQIHGATRTPR